MTYRIIYTPGYNKRAARFLKKHPEFFVQYEKTLRLMELDPYHPSLRLHKLKGALSDLLSVSINISYRITLEFIIQDETLIPVDVGSHQDVYR